MTAVVSLMCIVTIPGLAVSLVVLAAIDRMGAGAHHRLRLPWRETPDGRPMAAAGLDELQAFYYATKRHEIDQRRTSLVLRDEENDGAPPRGVVDLDAGHAMIRRAVRPDSAAARPRPPSAREGD